MITLLLLMSDFIQGSFPSTVYPVCSLLSSVRVEKGWRKTDKRRAHKVAKTATTICKKEANPGGQCTPVIPPLRRWMQENGEEQGQCQPHSKFEVHSDYLGSRVKELKSMREANKRTKPLEHREARGRHTLPRTTARGYRPPTLGATSGLL